MTARKAFQPFEFKLSETGAILVAFSRFDVVDSDDDITRGGSMPAGKGVPMSAYGHSSWDGAPPTGKGVIGERDSLGIFDGSFFMETDQGRNAYHTTKAMADLQEWSYGYNVLDGSSITMDGKRVRELRKLDVYEVSPVLKGAGVGTGTLAIKSGSPGPDAPYAEHLAWVLDEVKALSGRSTDRAAWRAKEGRSLSEANRAQLSELRKGLSAIGIDLDDLLTVSDPAKQALIAQAEIDNILAMAQAIGITS